MGFGLREILTLAPLAASAIASGGATLPMVALAAGGGSMLTPSPALKQVLGAGSLAAGIGGAMGGAMSGTPTGNAMGVPLQEATPGELSSIGMTPHATPSTLTRLQDVKNPPGGTQQDYWREYWEREAQRQNQTPMRRAY